MCVDVQLFVESYIMKVINHSEYQKSMKSKTWQELEYIIKDAQEAIKANPENPNNGYYQDEVCYAAQEKKKRMDRATRN